MNKQIFISLALCALISSSVFAEDQTSANQAPKKEIQQNNESTSQRQGTTELKKEQPTNVEKFKDFYREHKKAIRWGTSAVVAAFVLHKVMYANCPWYKNLIDGEDAETNKQPWARI